MESADHPPVFEELQGKTCSSAAPCKIWGCLVPPGSTERPSHVANFLSEVGR